MSITVPAAEPSEPSLPSTPFESKGRFSRSDLIVIGGGFLLLFAGWALQQAHDSQLETTEIAGIMVAHPEGWLPLPTIPPALAQWTDDQGLGATLTLYVEEPSATGVRSGSANPANANPAYTPLRSEPVVIGDTEAIQSDYAYARQQLAASTVPEIVRGREVSWAENGQYYALALEAPERDWNRFSGLFDAIATATIETGGAG